MNAAAFVASLRELGIEVSAAGDHLRVSAPQGLLAQGFAAELAARKAEILGHLRRQPRLPAAAEAPRRGDAVGSGAPPPAATVAPLSFNQLRLWFLHQLEPRSSAYNIPEALELQGPLDVAVLRAVVDRVVARHAALRTRFAAPYGEPFQLVAAALALPLPVVDLQALPPPRRREEARGLAAAEARRAFDLTARPLLRIQLLRLAADRHRLLLTVHHAVADGWSVAILVREMVALYGAMRDRQPSPLAAPAPAYTDFARWQRQRVSGELLAGQLAYWRERLAGAPPLLELPADRPRPAVATYRGATEPVTSPPALAGALRRLSREQGTTPFVTLLSAFNLLLLRSTGRTDLVVGVPIAYRNRPELEGLVGYLANTVVLRCDLAGDPPFAELLRRVHGALAGAFDHQDLPLEKLVEELRPERSLSYSPLFQVAFALQTYAREPVATRDLTVAPVRVESGNAKFDLTCFVSGAGSDATPLTAALEYSTELFDRTSVVRLWSHFENLLAAAAAGPETRLSALPLLAAAERHQLIAEWSDTARALPPETDLLARFAAQVALRPDREAVAGDALRLSYGELDRQANCLAHRLLGLGLRREGLVGIALERSPQMLVAVLAVLKAGGAYLPLDPAYPRERLQLMIDEALRPQAAPLVVTDAALAARLPLGGLRAVSALPAAPGLLAGAAPPAVVSAAEQLAYVLYTSGSTGRPKGVGVTRRALANFLCAMGERLGFGAGERLLSVTSLSFDIAALELFLPLVSGGTVEIHGGAAGGDEALLRRHLETSRARFLQATPATWQVLFEAGFCGGSGFVALCGGETLPRELARELAGRCGEAWNLYGPTETTVWSAACRLAAGEAGPVAIGRPLANTAIHLLGGEVEPVPVGVVGELAIGGDGLARGYLGRPELTAERFVPDPFARLPGSRLYRTGDLARRLPDGALQVLGRSDHQVKVRGYRVEPGEVEAVLACQPRVREAVVVVRGGAAADRRLVAYVVPREGEEPGPAWGRELREALARELPAYMVPSAFVLLGALPLTPNRKVDRAALPAPGSETAGEARAYVAPEGPDEELLAGIWARLLEVERVGADDDFFALGGHSLLAARMMTQAARALGVTLALREVFAAPTVAALAGRFQAARRGASGLALPPLAPRPRGGEAPLSFAQERLWFVDQLEPGATLYNLVLPLRVGGPLDLPALARGLGDVVRRHEALRTCFASRAGRPVQVVAAPGETALPVVDLAALPPAAREAVASRLAGAAARRPFDLARGPLWRTLLVRLAGADHLLLASTHHIVFDGSHEVFLRELARRYQAAAAGLPAPVEEAALQYGDFADWQRRWLAGEVGERQLAYWRARLAGAPAELALPFDRPRPRVRAGRGARRRFPLPRGLAQGLGALCRQEGITLFMAALAAFQALLARYCGQDDVVVGSPVADRPLPEVEEMIGCFVNTLVLRTDLAGATSGRELLARVRETCLGAYAHQDLPFERLVEAVQPERSLHRTPLFQVMLAVARSAAPRVELANLTFSYQPYSHPGARFDLLLVLAGDEELAGMIEFDRDLFDGGSITRLAGHLASLLRGLVEAPGAPLAAWPLLSAAERAQVVVEWNDTAAPIAAAGRTLDQLFAGQAGRTPRAPAVVAAGQTLLYGELLRRVEQLAAHLAALGAGPGSLVAVLLERSPEMVIALLAVLRAGAAYVPFDPVYPEERMAWILGSGGIRHLLTGSALLPRAGRLAARADLAEVVCLDRRDGAAPPRLGAARLTDLAHVDLAAPRDLAPRADPDAPAYVIFTSGTTGTPKGVVVRHRPVVNLIEWVNQTFAVGGSDRLLFVTSLAFDLSVYDIFGLLAAGGSLRIASDAEVATPDELLRILTREPITFWDSAPAMLQQVATLLPEATEAMPGGGALRLVFLSGDWVPVKLPGLVRRAFPRSRVVALGGATEAAVWSNFYRTESLDESWPSTPYGRPIRNARYYCLDARQEPCPIRVAGDLYIGGDCLSDGYAGDPARTAERYVPDPFAATPGARLYGTGDRARAWADGTLEFLGRLDRQVKIRGFRIELGEIESVLAEHPAVRQALVLAHDGPGGHRRLVAYAVPRPGAAPTAAELRAHLAERLPEYMLPAALLSLAALPLTANGKVDRKALPRPEQWAEDGAAAATAGAGRAARSPLEELLAGIWAEVLGVPAVGTRQSFFDLGGHSLLATQITARVKARLGLEVPLRLFFEQPTVAALAAAVAAGRSDAEAGTVPPLAPVPHDGPLPLSFAQERLWFLDQMRPGSPAWNLPAALGIRGALDVAALAAALGEVVTRHESLRTVFSEVAGEPVQIVLPPEPPRLPVVDLLACPEPRRAGEARRLTAASALLPFDLSLGPMMRATLLRLGREEHILLLCLHHIASDGWSMGIVVRETAALYQAAHAGRPSPLAPLPVQYADYARWQRGWLRGAALERQLAYWRARLTPEPAPLELPADRPAPEVPSQRGTSLSVRLPAGLAELLEDLGRQHAATLWMTLLAAFQALLGRYSGSLDLAVGLPAAGRGRIETEDLIGFFVNTLVVRTDLSGDPAFPELLARVRDGVLDAHAHQDVPFEKVVEELQPERRLSHSPLFQVMFAPGGVPAAAPAVPGLVLVPADVPAQVARVALALEAVRVPSGLSAALTYSTDLFDAATVARLAGHLGQLLAGVAALPGRRLSTLGLLSPGERQQLLVEWAGAAAAAPADPRCVHELVAGQAERRPLGIAAVDEHGAELTYGELDRRAGRLACRLRARGVVPESLVALAIEPSFTMLVGLLAVLKAGGAYVPLDPSYPRDRLAFMLDDCGARVLLTESAVRDRFAATAAQVVCCDDGEGRDDTGESPVGAAPPAPVATLDSAVYAIYTSGTSGRPKAVIAHHRGLAAFTSAMAAAVGLTPRDRVLQFASLSFDAAVVQVFPTLASGATLVLHRNPRALSSTELLAFCGRAGVTVLDLPAALWRQWIGDLAAVAGAGESPAFAAPVRMFLTGGESVPTELLREWRRWAGPGAGFLSSYGPTEATVTTTIYTSTSDADGPHGAATLPLGLPLAGSRVYLVDGGGEPVPAGVRGELLIGGPGVTRGYLGSPALTAERFIPDPFGGAPGGRLYRTGDAARRLAEGSLQFLGRVDNQVKIRGYRIEPGDVEAQLTGIAGVRRAAVVPREVRPGDLQLVAFVQPAPAGGGEPIDIAGLRELLRSRLPEHMVPAAFVLLDELPLTPGGKVDRRALRSRELVDIAGGSRPDYLPPGDETERRVAAVWQEVLEVPQVGLHDNFFELGGHSLLIVKVQRKLKETLGRDVAMVDLFRAPTVAALARLLSGEPATRQEAAAEGDERAAARREGRQRRGRRRAEELAPAAPGRDLEEEPAALAGIGAGEWGGE